MKNRWNTAGKVVPLRGGANFRFYGASKVGDGISREGILLFLFLVRSTEQMKQGWLSPLVNRARDKEDYLKPLEQKPINKRKTKQRDGSFKPQAYPSGPD